ncbi:FAD/NAD(P)-binding protein [Macrococcoides caseolyticum]|uniref:FAD/NAD(P)-binding protein n=1 Tax=Macrococcoides caseolyticum TaxID=69966 RepID=UPI001F1891FB|nr:FAD/NAD(P)-binding protein [Macrococcus caseolyticus]MCE4956413.1 FAD/NAD(P)-binding protein [Macrococcus caseolyticus]
MKIAVIGTGVAGVNVLKYLSKEKNIAADILCFDDQLYLGNGRAFQYDDPELLMNYPGNLISMKPNKPGDFVKWIEKNETNIKLDIHLEEKENKSGNQYYSRQLFGKYMTAHFEKYTKKKNVTIIRNHVRNIEKIDNGYLISTQDESFTVDAVFLSPGQFGPMDPYQLVGIENYFKWPYPLHRIQIEENKDYAVIGTGLSAVDVVRYLTPELNTKLYLVSRDGKVQSVRGEMAEIKFKYMTQTKLEKLKAKNNGFLPLESLIELFYKEAAHHEINIEQLFHISRVNPLKAITFDLGHPVEVGYLQSFVYNLTQMGAFIWPFMTRSDKQDYLQNYAHYIEAYANPMPEATAMQVVELMNNNRLEILSGIEQIEYKYNKFRIHTKDKEIRVHYVINATGPAKHFKDAIEPNPLIENLVNQDLLIAHPDGGFYVTPIHNEVIGATGKLEHFYLLGQKCGGVNYMNNGIVELALEAKRTVDCFKQTLLEG